jgi:integrative and conjugative element protein (TIGR02256 family)
MCLTIKSYKIVISDRVIEIFNQYIQDTAKKDESGGILLGQVVGEKICITKVSIPNRFDKAGRCKFIRDSKAAQIIIDYEFINSNKKTIYLGEWHTHPEISPNPSSIDIKMLEQQFKNNRINEKYLLLIIRGLQDIYVALYDGKGFEGKLLELR